jgi:hypothetical protein
MSAKPIHPGDNKDAGKSKRTGYYLTAVVIALALLLLAAGFGRVRAGATAEGSGDEENSASSAALPLPTTKEDFFLPGTQPNADTHQFVEIADPTACDSCHTDPIYKAWRGSMMGQAGRDPIFWSAFAVAQNDATDAGEYCLRCHAPRGWYSGRSEPSDGSALTTADIGAGLACEVCHRMVDPVAGANDQAAARDAVLRAELADPPPTDHFGSAMLILDTADNRRGPFAFAAFGYHVRWQTVFLGQSDAQAASRLCGSCHNVENPLLSWNENPPGGGPAQYWPNAADAAAPSFGKDDLFPIERTYEEWLNSDYANGGVYAPQFAGAKPDGIVASCQDCHMARQTGLAAETFFNPVFRNCGATGCLPAHILVGGNTWAPKIIQDSRWRLSNPADTSALNLTIIEAQSMLRRAATVEVDLEIGGNQKIATVRVINETGHKLPTGYPEGRRMWVNLRAYNAAGVLIFESGAYNLATGVLNESGAKIYEAKQGLTPQWAAQLGLPLGATFHFALNNTTIKDNRIPPRGYTVAAFDRPGMRPVGATYEDGQYWDDTEYVVPAATARVEVTLYYQLVSKEYVDFLRELGGADGATLGELWDDSKSPPEIVAQAQFPLANEIYSPVIGK